MFYQLLFSITANANDLILSIRISWEILLCATRLCCITDFCDNLLLVKDNVVLTLNVILTLRGLFGRLFPKWIHDDSMWSLCFSHMLTRNLFMTSYLARDKVIHKHLNFLGCAYLSSLEMIPGLPYLWGSGIYPDICNFLMQVWIWKHFLHSFSLTLYRIQSWHWWHFEKKKELFY